MDYEVFRSKLASVFKQYWLPIIIGSLGLIFLGYGLIYLFGSNSNSSEPSDIVFQSGENSKNSVKTIVVDVEGAVVNPGVYSLADDARVQDALIAAGGFSENANRTWIAKNLNLAAKLLDSAKIYIPVIGEDVSLVAGVNSQSIGSSTISSSGQININTATSSELDALPGIGVITAGKIIESRPYVSINDLLSKKVVSNKVFEDIKDKIIAN